MFGVFCGIWAKADSRHSGVRRNDVKEAGMTATSTFDADLFDYLDPVLEKSSKKDFEKFDKIKNRELLRH